MGSQGDKVKRVRSLRVKIEKMPSKEKLQEAFEKACSAADGKLTFCEMKEVIELVSSEEESKYPDFDKMCDRVSHSPLFVSDLFSKYLIWAPMISGDMMFKYGEEMQVFEEPKLAAKGAFLVRDDSIQSRHRCREYEECHGNV